MSQTNSTTSIQYIKPLKIKGPFKTDLKEFENDKLFNEYYRNHQDELDAMTTYQLNKSFHVPGYHIAKIKSKEDPSKKEIMLTKEYYRPINKVYEEYISDTDNKMAKEILQLKNQIKEMQHVIEVLVNDYNTRNNLA